MSVNYKCVECGELLMVVATGSKVKDKAATICVGCLKNIKNPESSKGKTTPYTDFMDLMSSFK